MENLEMLGVPEAVVRAGVTRVAPFRLSKD